MIVAADQLRLFMLWGGGAAAMRREPGFAHFVAEQRLLDY